MFIFTDLSKWSRTSCSSFLNQVRVLAIVQYPSTYHQLDLAHFRFAFKKIWNDEPLCVFGFKVSKLYLGQLDKV